MKSQHSSQSSPAGPDISEDPGWYVSPFILLKEYYIFNLLPSPPNQRKTVSTKKPCKKKAAPGKKSKHELEPARSWKHEQQCCHAKKVHRRPTTLSFPLSFGRLSGMHSTPYSSLSLCKAGGPVQVALDRAKSSGGQHEGDKHMNV